MTSAVLFAEMIPPQGSKLAIGSMLEGSLIGERKLVP